MNLSRPASLVKIAVLLIAATAACSSSGGDNSGSSSSEGDGGSGRVCVDGICETPGGGTSSSAVCGLYISCMGLVAPSGQAAILAAYGPDGSCWANSETTIECQTACAAGLMTEREDPQNFVSCPECKSTSDCAASTPVCANGTCTCGVVGQSCASDEGCCAGTCNDGVCGCPAGETACGAICIDLETDPDHCGGCSTACPPSATCSSGQCVCPGDQVACGGFCTDKSSFQSDDSNCGACGATCASRYSCTGGACETYCNEGEGACTSTNPDPGTTTCEEACKGAGSGFICGPSSASYQCADPAPNTEPASCTDTLANPPSSEAGCDNLFLNCDCVYAK